MTPKERFIELLEEDATQAKKAAQDWDNLITQHGAIQLEDLEGNVVASAEAMLQKYLEREQELRAFIEEVKAL